MRLTNTNVFALFALATLGLSLRTEAALYQYNFNSGFANGGAVPDANVNGWSDTRNISDISVSEPYIADVNVTLNISGGYNGDLYVYLTHSGGFSVLLNRVGRTSGNSFGYGNSGFNVTLDDQAATTTDIHSYQTVSYSLNGSGQLIGDWRPDGRDSDPATVLDTDSRTSPLTVFNNLDPNGNWTLFVADLSSGASSTVVDWGLYIQAVPEPAHYALYCALGLLAISAIRTWRERRRRDDCLRKVSL
jgi:subtilisin-like proprotein convertase family protein